MSTDEIASLSSLKRLASTPHASLEKVATESPASLDLCQEIGELRQLETKMEALDRGFSLMQEIRNSLEHALHKLSSQE